MSHSVTQICRWHAFEHNEALQTAAVELILAAANHAIAQRGAFHLVLAGGTTPQKVYAALRDADAAWTHWHIYFGDERCLAPDHAERNSQMANQVWLQHVPIPPQQIHPIEAESGAETAAQKYMQLIDYIELFDLSLLGLGEDGHTASLFPAHPWGTSTDSPACLAVFNAPKPPSERVSLSAHQLSQARQTLFLVTGSGKQAAVQRWRTLADIPAAAITPASGVDIFLTQDLIK